MTNPHQTKLLKAIQKLGFTHSIWSVYSDFIEICAVAIANSVNRKHFDEREKRFHDTMKKYNKNEQTLLADMFVDLTNALDYEITHRGAPSDVLGAIFHDLELHSHYKGQFFTPQHVCNAMGAIALHDLIDTVKQQGHISISEPACGSGALVLGFAKAMLDAGFNYCNQLVVTATDIDIKCVHMAFVQLSLYGIPAIVIHGNTITLEKYSCWHTPIYIIHGFKNKT